MNTVPIMHNSQFEHFFDAVSTMRCGYCMGRGRSIEATERAGHFIAKPCQHCNGTGFKNDVQVKIAEVLQAALSELNHART